MATTVISAFNEFLKDKVNLDPEQTKKARASKDWLINQIHNFPINDTEFPKLYSDVNIGFGSFARKTKKRPIDDIDLMIGISAEHTTYTEYSNRIEMNVPESASNLRKLCHDYTNKLNSIKVINRFIKSLENIPQYSKSEINRNQEAAVLNLTSYDWSFDIVPCFHTTPDPNHNNRIFYLIPDGSGNWKFTDPRLDRDRVTNINTKQSGRVLQLIRLMK